MICGVLAWSSAPAKATINPPSLTATAGNAEINFSWTAIPVATHYELWQSPTGNAGSWTINVTLLSSSLSYRWLGLTNGRTYYSRVRAIKKDAGQTYLGEWSNVVPIWLPPTPTAAPANFSAITGNARVSLSWNMVPGATFYNIWRRVGNAPFSIVQTVNTTSWVDTVNTGVTNGTTYDYAINAGNSSGTANAYSYLSATPLSPIPPAPTQFSASSSDGGPVVLQWAAVGGATSYEILRSYSSGGNYSSIGTATGLSWTDSFVIRGIPHYYVVVAKYNGATSAKSSEASVTPLDFPFGLTVVPRVSDCYLSWNPVVGATSYIVQVQYRDSLYRSQTRSFSTTATNYSISFPSTSYPSYVFTVQAINSNASSGTVGTTGISPASFNSDLYSLSLWPTTVHGVDSSTGAVALTNVAPSVGAVIRLSSNNPAVSVPYEVTIPAGVTGATFPITVSAVASPQTATITASYAGVTQTTTLTLTVNRAPVAASDSASTTSGTAIDIPVLTNDSDADGDTLTISTVAQSSKGTTSLNANKTIRYVPNSGASGSDSFVYVVNDGHGGTASATVSMTINVANRAPVANAQSVTTNEDTAKAIALTATDADGNALQYSIVTPPTKGTLSGTAPNLTYTPNLNLNGTDSFTFKANDGTIDSNIATVSITINPVNDAPVAVNDSANTPQGVAKDIAVLANDSDVDGDALTVTTVTQGSKGASSINANGTIRYVPTAGTSGTDSFSYTISDGNGGTASAIVTIAVPTPTPTPATPTPTPATPTPTPATPTPTPATPTPTPATPTPTPSATTPTKLQAYATGSGKITLYWSPVDGATGYNVYRGTSAGTENYAVPVNGVTLVNSPSYPGSTIYVFTDTGLTNGTEYFYTVKAVVGGIQSVASNEDSEIVDPAGIPWDTRNVGLILNAAMSEANAAEPDGESIEADDTVVVGGPDGTSYELGESAPIIPVIGQGQGNTLALDDGTNLAMPTAGGIDDSQAMRLMAGPAWNNINNSGGPYIGYRSFRNTWRGLTSDLQLPPASYVNVTPLGVSTHMDTPCCYLGIAGPIVIDAGLMYKGGVWYPYYNAGIKTPNIVRGSRKRGFFAGEVVRMKIYFDPSSNPVGVNRKRFVYLQMYSVLDDERKAVYVMNQVPLGSANYIRPKRYMQLAQNNTGAKGSGAIGTDSATGSFMSYIGWSNTYLYPLNPSSGRVLWTSQYTNTRHFYSGPNTASLGSTVYAEDYWDRHDISLK